MTTCRNLAAAVLLLLLGTVGASANTMTLSTQSSSSAWNAVFDGNPYANVHITGFSGGVAAGGFQLKDGTNSFVAWCLDILDELSLPSVYHAATAPFVGTKQGDISGRVGDILKLFEVSYPLVHMNNAAESGGFQLALWELVNETDLSSDFNVSTGAWKATSTTDAGALSFANSILANLGGATLQKYALTFYQSESNSQNLVGATPVPLPAAAWFLGTGFIGLYGIGRRGRKAERSDL